MRHMVDLQFNFKIVVLLEGRDRRRIKITKMLRRVECRDLSH